MLDENLPTFFIKPSSSDNPLQSTIYFSQHGSELQPEYTLRRPDPSLPASKNCYAVALYDSYNPEVLFGEVLVQPEWTQPTLSQAEIRAQNGITPPPVPIVPNSFTIQLYNPDQQVTVRQIAGSWNSSAHWEFEMPQNSFRVPSASSLDRSQDDPAASVVTPKIAFKWKRDGKLSKDISCFLSGKTTDGKKNKEPDITVAMFKGGKGLTVYQPNMHRVDVEDVKGLEVVLILGGAVIKDIFFNANREMFNISSPQTTNPRRKNSGPVISGKPGASSPPTMSGAVLTPPPPRQNHVPASQIPPQQYARPQQQQATRPPPTDPRTQWEIDQETERLKKLVEAEEKEQERADRAEQKRIKKMLEQEEKERKRRDEEVAKETERLRRQYGVQGTSPPRVQFAPPNPPMPPRPQPQPLYQQQQPGYNPQARPGAFPQYQSAPHSRPVPAPRPVSTHSVAGAPGAFNISSLNNLFAGSHGPSPKPPRQSSGSGPYLNPGNAGASSSGFFGLGGREGKKVQKKRSVYF
jgi:hypothetical protein